LCLSDDITIDKEILIISKETEQKYMATSLQQHDNKLRNDNKAIGGINLCNETEKASQML
jgi:hypothetical protein